MQVSGQRLFLLTGAWLGPRASLNTVGNRKIFLVLGIEPKPLVHSARNLVTVLTELFQFRILYRQC
jgi:hypothetical protein